MKVYLLEIMKYYEFFIKVSEFLMEIIQFNKELNKI